MKHKVSELEGALLDAAVAKAEGGEVFEVRGDGEPPYPYFATRKPRCPHRRVAAYSTDWNVGGPIIERERIAVYFDDGWIAGFDLGIDHWDYGGETGSGSSLELRHSAAGPTPLIAAMRAYVASKFGDEVELP